MTILDELSYYWSQHVAKGIAEKTIVLLESKSDLMYEKDTCLTNNWEGVCVQVQAEQPMIDWDAGIQEIHSFLYRYYDALPVEEQFTLWTQTEAGQEWFIQAESTSKDAFAFKSVPCQFEDCVKLLMTTLLEMALDFKNDNIINYIEYDCNGIEEDDYEEEEEEYDE